MNPHDSITLALWILALPLAGFVAQLALGRRLPRQGDWLATGTVGLGAVLAWRLFLPVLTAEGGHGIPTAVARRDWLALGSGPEALTIPFGVLVDNLTAVMLVVVTTVSFLVHLYSCGYMRDHHGHPEQDYARFFAYLQLFTFSMLGLCITDSLFFLFVFWELVGVCSYFLIGFYYFKPSAAHASMKAFLTTRVGDLGFFLAICIIWQVAGSFAYSDVFASVREGRWAGLTLAGLPLLPLAGVLLFLGPVGKSGQFPLHVWLPDAMEGPTPVSALIHAATMVAA
ncbi:MAG: NADH-quinone oxidoreductase subunit L, partial [Planctomycetes bacterium]|nr:NADH-quinone oxidoreductase subunit L [Planctomycetota bacterium]